MATIAPYGIYQAFDDNGDPLSGGFLYTYEAGTTTPKATYTTAAGDVENLNPVELDVSGQANVWLGDGGYKFILEDADGNTIFTTDNIGGSSDTAFGGQVNSISTNTDITSVYQNSANIVTLSPTLSLLPASEAEEGFYFSVKNEGTGTVTIDPDAGELIDGASTATIGPGQSALIITNGVAWYTFFFGVVATGDNTWSGTNTFTGKVLTPSDGTLTIASGAITVTGVYHLVDTEAAASVDQLDTINGGAAGQRLILRTADDARDVVITTAGNINTPSGSNITLGSTDSDISLLYDGAKSKWIVQAVAIPSAVTEGSKDTVLSGLILSNNVSDATNDIDIAIGAAVSDDGTTVMALTSSITKRLDAAWAVGTNQGGLDTGSIADATYHVWLINRPDTNVTDVLFSLSASSPTMPANYTKKKCIGSIIRASSTILSFFQNKNIFTLNAPILGSTFNNQGTSAVTRATGVPTGVKFIARLVAMAFTGVNNFGLYVSSLDSVDAAPQVPATTTLNAPVTVSATAGATVWVSGYAEVRTDTSAQVRTRISASAAGDRIALITNGWIDPRI